MPSSLLRYANRTTTDRGRLHWGRAGQDFLPFRGESNNLTEDEFETRVTRVADARNAFFDVCIPEQNKQFLEILECCWNRWFQLVHLERFWVGPDGRRTTTHYVEWVEYYLEDGTRTPFSPGGNTELSYGQSNVVGDPG